MSLKIFHLVFISAAVILCLILGIWCFNQPGRIVMGTGSLIVAVGLVVYETIFLKKFHIK